MTKKSFLDNPALKFIDIPQEQNTDTPPEPKPELGLEQNQPAPAAVTTEQQGRLDELRAIIPEGFTIPEGYRLEKIVERRTKRIQLVIEPSLYNKLKAAAGKAGISVNEYAIQALNEKITKENEE